MFIFLQGMPTEEEAYNFFVGSIETEGEPKEDVATPQVCFIAVVEIIKESLLTELDQTTIESLFTIQNSSADQL